MSFDWRKEFYLNAMNLDFINRGIDVRDLSPIEIEKLSLEFAKKFLTLTTSEVKSIKKEWQQKKQDQKSN